MAPPPQDGEREEGHPDEEEAESKNKEITFKGGIITQNSLKQEFCLDKDNRKSKLFHY